RCTKSPRPPRRPPLPDPAGRRLRRPARERPTHTRRRTKTPFERAHGAVALDGIIDLGIAGIDILGHFALLEHARGRVFEGGLHVVGVKPEPGRDRLRESPRVVSE